MSYWERNKRKLKFRPLINENRGNTAAVVTSRPLFKFPEQRKLLINPEKLDFEKLKDFVNKYFLQENSFYGDPDTMASIAIAAHVLLAGNTYTYAFLALMLFDYPELQPNKYILYKLGDSVGHSVYREVNRCMHDNSDYYSAWLNESHQSNTKDE